MATIPGREAIGGRPGLRSPAIVPIDRSGPALARAAVESADRVFHAATIKQGRDDKAAYASAKSRFITADIEARRVANEAENFEDMESTYREILSKARDGIMQGFKGSAADGQLLDLDFTADTERGASVVNNAAFARETDFERAGLNQTLLDNYNSALEAGDARTRTGIVQNVMDAIDAKREDRFITEQEAQSFQENWTSKFAEGFLSLQSPETRIAMLQAAEPTFQTGDEVAGMIEPGNIDIANRPRVVNDDGTISTVRSISIGVDGNTVVIPTVKRGGVMSNEEAVQTFQKTGEHLGVFASQGAADDYSEALHQQQEEQMNRGGFTVAEFIDPVRRKALLKAAMEENKDEQVRSQSQEISTSIWDEMSSKGGTIDDMLHAARNRDYPETFGAQIKDSTITRLRNRWAEKNSAESEIRSETYEDWGNRIWSGDADVDDLRQDRAAVDVLGPDLIARLEAIEGGRGRPIQTDPEAWAQVVMLSNEELAKLEPMDFRTKMADQQWYPFVSAVKEARSGKVDFRMEELQSALSAVTDAVGGEKGRRTNRGKAAVLEVARRMEAKQTLENRPLTEVERNEIIEGVMTKVLLPGTGWFGSNVGREVRRAGTVTLKNVPDEEVKKIMADFFDVYNRYPNPDEVLSTYALKFEVQ